MRALVIKQPHAHRIVCGDKRYELRSWRTHYQGPVAILAAKRHDANFPEARRYPAGGVVAVATIAGITAFTENLVPEACLPWRDGLWAWRIEHVRPTNLIPMRGQLGLFAPPEGVRDILRERFPDIFEGCHQPQ